MPNVLLRLTLAVSLLMPVAAAAQAAPNALHKFFDRVFEAERQLGPKFDVRDFHDVILRNGVLPLDLLQEEARAYINSAK